MDILTKIAALDFGAAWSRRVMRRFGTVSCPVLCIEDLLVNKRAAGRPQDLADVDALEQILKMAPP